MTKQRIASQADDAARGGVRRVNYDDFQREAQRLKRERWAKILASEPPGRVAGRRPRDPHKERILLRLDRARLARERGDLGADADA